MLFKDIRKVSEDIRKACYVLNINTGKQIECSSQEGWGAVERLLPFLFDNIEHVDLVIFKQALVSYMGYKIRYEYVEQQQQEKVSLLDKFKTKCDIQTLIQQKTLEMESMTEEPKVETKQLLDIVTKSAKQMGILEGDNMVDKLEVGTTIIDRNGVEHKAYSMLLNKETRDKVEELLPKINVLVTVNNTTNDAYNALLEIISMALNGEKDIETFLDAEFANKVIRVFLNMPVM